MKLSTLICVASLFTATLLPASATVTLLNSYHLGDLDGGAANGALAITSQDYRGGAALSFMGYPTYSTDVPPDYPLPDTYSLDFTGTNYGIDGTLASLTDDFGIQAWVKVRSLSSGNHAIAYNGNTGANGWGLYIVGNTFQGLFGGVAFFGSAPVQTNVWTHLALVRDQGVTTLYVDGVACGASSATPNAPNGLWALGASPPDLNSEFFDGLIDEVSVFTFADGAFSTNDLLYCPPASRVLATTFDGTTVTLNWPAVRTDLELEGTTNLVDGTWTTLTYATNANEFTFSDSPTNGACYYRLIKPAVNPLAAPVPAVNLTKEVISSGTTITNTVTLGASSTLNSQNQSFVFDATPSQNAHTGTDEALSFQWLLAYSAPQPVADYTDAGIQGADTSMLNIQQFALAQTNEGQVVTFELIVTDTLTGSQTSPSFFYQVVDGTLDLAAYSECQTQTTACPTCTCTVSAALPYGF